jgi:hypothetical protein
MLMARKSITRADLAKAVYQQGIVTKEHAADLGTFKPSIL